MWAERIPAMLSIPTGPPRTSGVHLSGLTRSMAVDYGLLDRKWIQEELKLVEVREDQETWWNGLDEPSKVRMSIGLAWEAWYLPQIAGVVHQPGEMCLNGIFMTPDGESLEVVVTETRPRPHHHLFLHEVKTTSKSTNTVGDLNVKNPKNWMWLTPMKCYCKGAGTTSAYLHILYLYGDYSYPLSPIAHVWQIEFTQDEVDETWQLVEDYRDAKASLGLLN